MLLNCGARGLLRVPWSARRSNLSILKEINPQYSLEWLKLKLKLWPPDVKSWLIGKDPDARKDWGQEKNKTSEDMMAGWHYQLNGHEFEQISGDSEDQGRLTCLQFTGLWRVRHDLVTEKQQISVFIALLWKQKTFFIILYNASLTKLVSLHIITQIY